ncbi:MAG: DUF4825 domain-containing protein [Clostridiales bacterium]|jgi:beta-lactamase regulating signal transducer with metallopeptidase domain|nr:DUF4825 domain-containing protein [Clostridiales bacterium]
MIADKIFLSFLNISLTSSFVIAVVTLARLALKRAPKWISYALWAVVLFNLVSPFKPESVLSLNLFKPAPIPLDIGMQPIPRIDSGVSAVNDAVSSFLPSAAEAASVNPLQVWITAGAYIWFVGLAVMLIYAFASYSLLKRRLRFATKREGNVYETDRILSPFVLGFVRPRIYLPVGIADADIAYILCHERTHIKRRDYLVKPAAFLALAIHWFNPLVWLAYFLLNVDMEMSCDERVLKELGGGVKTMYSGALLALSTGKRLVGLSPLAFGEGVVKERVKNVLNFKKRSRLTIIAAVALLAALSAGFAVSKANMPLNGDTVQKEPHFRGVVTEVFENSILVSVNEGEEVRRSSDLIDVSLDIQIKDSIRNFLVGDEVIVYYDGIILETYPGKLGKVYFIALISPDRYLNSDDIAALYALRTPYVGNNSAVGKIISALPPIDGNLIQRFFSIGDDYGSGHAPYTLTVYYEQEGNERNITIIPKNAVLLYSLIDNLEEVNFAFRSTIGGLELDKAAYTSRISLSKEQVAEFISDMGLTWEDFQNRFEESAQRLFATPDSSTATIDAEYYQQRLQRA